MKKYKPEQNFPKDITGDKNGHWKGGIHFRCDGYVLIRQGVFRASHRGAIYKLLHRIVMEEHLKRPLLRSEIVHHKNGDKIDNSIENLEILSNQSVHASLHNNTRKRNKLGQFIT